jgi:sec-independent protein translocase protein TatA
MLGNIGLPELIVILGIILLVFGAGRVPEIARSLGSAVNEFKKGMSGEAPAPAAKKRVRKAKS